MIWAAKMDRRNLVRRLLRLGAEVNTRGMPVRRGTPLHAAAAAGHFGMIELLLKKGGSPEVCGAKGLKPLLLALLAGHEEIAIFLFSKLSDPNSRIADEAVYTSLHAACFRKLPKSARVFLESGADIHARTSKGNTPLHLALKPEASDKSNDTIRSGTLELVMLLLEFGSVRDAKAYRLGLQHPDLQVRDIFQEHKSLIPQGSCFINIGRRWSVEVSSDADYVLSPMLASSSLPWKEQLPSGEEDFLTTVCESLLDDRVFPVLESSRSLREQQPSFSGWDPSKVKKITESLLAVESTEAEMPSGSPPVELFPKLIGRISPHPLESAAQLSWRDSRNPKMQHTIEEVCTNSKGKVQEPKSQARQGLRKKRWQPFQLS